VARQPHPDDGGSDGVHPQDRSRDDEQAFQHTPRLSAGEVASLLRNRAPHHLGQWFISAG
jgi:hypothetical protein